MVKKFAKIGNSQGIVFDTALMDQACVKVGDAVNVSIHEGGVITLTPLRPVIGPEKAAARAKKLIRKNSELFRRLS